MSLQQYIESVLPPEMVQVMRQTATGTNFVGALAALVSELDRQIAHMELPSEFDMPTILKHHAAVRDLMKTRDAYKEFVDLLRNEQLPLNIQFS